MTVIRMEAEAGLAVGVYCERRRQTSGVEPGKL
jgi:hypothetical protein